MGDLPGTAGIGAHLSHPIVLQCLGVRDFWLRKRQSHVATVTGAASNVGLTFPDHLGISGCSMASRRNVIPILLPFQQMKKSAPPQSEILWPSFRSSTLPENPTKSKSRSSIFSYSRFSCCACGVVEHQSRPGWKGFKAGFPSLERHQNKTSSTSRKTDLYLRYPSRLGWFRTIEPSNRIGKYQIKPNSWAH